MRGSQEKKDLLNAPTEVLTTLHEVRLWARQDLQQWSKLLGKHEHDFWRSGVHSGHLNALDHASPHAAQSLQAVMYWHGVGVAYVMGWALEHGVKLHLADRPEPK